MVILKGIKLKSTCLEHLSYMVLSAKEYLYQISIRLVS